MSAITIILSISGYCGYFTGTWINYSNQTHRLYGKSGFCNDFKKLNYLHLRGIIVMGLPLIFLDEQEAIFLPGALTVSIPKLMVLTALVLLTAYVGRITAISASQRLPGTNDLKDTKSLAIYLPVRIIFLVAYEFFFRGVLLAGCLFYLDVKWAILLNVALYTLLHFFSEKEEIIFCPLFGAILCILTIWFQSVIPAVILHATLSFSHEGHILKKITNPLKHYQS